MSSPDRRDGPGGRNGLVRAAGCVLWRRAPYEGEHDGGYDGGYDDSYDGGIEICLVHRPRYDDWSHPKGKLKRGEDPLSGALREVLEETGHHCRPGVRLPTVRYTVGGRPKQVEYWAAESTGGAFVPGDEVDRLLWLPPAAAEKRLTERRDREVLAALPAALRTA